MSTHKLVPGTLQGRVTELSKRIRKQGREPYRELVEDAGVRFLLTLLDQTEKRKEQTNAENPFLHPDPELIIADLSETHLAILNRYSVWENHLLIITRAFEPQEMLLTLADFEALWICMREYEAIGFYNGGRDAGASQAHKHLQLLPLPFFPKLPSVPIEPLVSEALEKGLSTIPRFSFLHTFAPLNRNITSDPQTAARICFKLYGSLLGRLGMPAPLQGVPMKQVMPYNLLLTRDWMLLAPRSRECFNGISLNSLAYAGSFYVQNREELDLLKGAGLLQVLASVSLPDRKAFNE
ncbi:MAG: phosphorylase [Nitrospirota bacterium]